MNISKAQQRILHALARGGRIVIERDDRGTLAFAECLTREGWAMADFTLDEFKAMKRRRLIISRDGGPYLISREGLLRLRPQADNRVSGRGW